MSVSFFPFLKRLFILLSLPLLFLSACSQPFSLQKTSNTPNNISNSDASNIPHLAWTAPIDTDNTTVYDEPVVVNGMLYYQGGSDLSNQKLYAFDAATGQQKWTAASTEDYLYYIPVVVNGVVYNNHNHRIQALDAATGQQKWTADTGFTNDSMAVANGILYVTDDTGIMHALDAATGQQKWTSSLGGRGGIYPPVITNGVLYSQASGKSYNWYAMDAATGQLKWTSSLPTGLDPPAVVANGIFYITIDKLYALDAATGQQKWTAGVDNEIYGSVAVANGLVYADYPKSEKLEALDAATGQVKWTASAPPTDLIGSPVVANGVVYATYENKYNLYALDAATGQQKWTLPLGDPPAPPRYGPTIPTIANGMVYFAYPGVHKLYAFSLN